MSIRVGQTPGAALVRRRSLLGFRTACQIMWGSDGCRKIVDALPEDVRDRTAGLSPLPEWLPVADLIAWHVAVRNGPGKDDAVFTQHVHLTVDQGFGKVKRLLLSMATPQLLAPRAAALWRDEYSSGRLESRTLDSHCVALTLREHPFVGDVLMQSVIAEVYRYIVSLTSAKRVRASSLVRPGELIVSLSWT